MNQLSFLPEPIQKLRRPPEPIMRSAIVEGSYRWELRRQWGPGPTLGIVGHNPSIADGTIDDPTMWREMCFALAWGYGSIIKVNLYPIRTPHPMEVDLWRCTPEFRHFFERNIREATAALVECKTIVAGWGANAEPRDVTVFVQEIERRLGAVEWMCMGTNADGSPKHALARGRHRIPDNQKLETWRKAA